jgi:osmotically-inducible protein OsmY
MGEYEDRYPDAFGRGEESEPTRQRRDVIGFGLPHQVQDDEPAVAEASDVAEGAVAATPSAGPAPPMAHHYHPPRRVFIERDPADIYRDVVEQLDASPLVDATGISVAVDGSDVTLDGTINSLFAASVARSLASQVPGVGRVQVQLKVRPAPRGYETPPAGKG